MDVYEISQSVVPQYETFDLRLGGFNFALELYDWKSSVLFLFFYTFVVYMSEFLLDAWKFPTNEKFLKFPSLRPNRGWISLRLAALKLFTKASAFAWTAFTRKPSGTSSFPCNLVVILNHKKIKNIFFWY